MTAVLGVFIRALFGLYRRMARDYGIEQTQSGAVTFVQRFGSSANLNLDFHVICTDGVYAPGLDGQPEFFALRPPENGEVRELAQLLAKRIPALLKRRGIDTPQSDEEESDRLARDQPWLSEVYAASVSGRIATGPEAGRRVAVGGDRVDPEGIDSSASPRCAAVAGFSLHGNVSIGARDCDRLERLFRYAARPPVSIDRLEALPDGRLRYWFKTAWRNGTTHAIFEPLQFLEKLAALVPTPRAHLVRFHGLLGPAAKWRPSIVPNNAATAAPLDSPDTARTGVTSGGADAVNSHGSEKLPTELRSRHLRFFSYHHRFFIHVRIVAVSGQLRAESFGRFVFSTIDTLDVNELSIDFGMSHCFGDVL